MYLGTYFLSACFVLSAFYKSKSSTQLKQKEIVTKLKLV